VETDAVLELLLRANQLKRVPRTGWVMRGVADAESVADHSFGVAFISLMMAELVEPSLDKAKVLTIALLHDLPESVLSDIPTPAAHHFPSGVKGRAELEVLGALLHSIPGLPNEPWRDWWQEFEDGTSAEARLVRDADRLDMFIQAYVYEQTTGNRWLEEFWSSPEIASFEFAVARTLYKTLRALRQ
jgi:putative hydrolase of HD superfamily